MLCFRTIYDVTSLANRPRLFKFSFSVSTDKIIIIPHSEAQEREEEQFGLEGDFNL